MTEARSWLLISGFWFFCIYTFFVMNDIYRQAASLLVLRPRPGVDSTYDLLLLHKPRKRDAWQLPQGGVEAGETVEQAALRELQEEAGINTATVLGVSEKVYQYDFPSSFRRFRPDNVKGQQIGFVLAKVPANTVVRVDDNEIDGHVWIGIDELGNYIRRTEYTDLIRGLYEEALQLSR